MSQFLQWLGDLNPFIQSVLGSAVFASLVWLGSKIIKWFISLNKDLRKSRDIDLMTKYWIHKNYVNAGGLYFFTQGYLYTLTKALQWFLKATIAVSFYFGVTATLKGNILGFFVSALVCSWVYEGYSWVKDNSSDDVIKKIDPKIKEEVLSRLGNPRDNMDLMLGKSSSDKSKKDDKVPKSKIKSPTNTDSN
jgi:hypothetical protein